MMADALGIKDDEWKYLSWTLLLNLVGNAEETLSAHLRGEKPDLRETIDLCDMLGSELTSIGINTVRDDDYYGLCA